MRPVDFWMGLVHPAEQQELKRELDLHFTGETPILRQNIAPKPKVANGSGFSRVAG